MNTTLTQGFDGGRPSDAREAVARTAGLVSMAVLAVGLGGLALGVEWAWVAFPLGYGGVLPLAVGWAKSRGRSGSVDGRHRDDADEALATLRERYARGDIDDLEFERRVERLVETEDADR